MRERVTLVKMQPKQTLTKKIESARSRANVSERLVAPRFNKWAKCSQSVKMQVTFVKQMKKNKCEFPNRFLHQQQKKRRVAVWRLVVMFAVGFCAIFCCRTMLMMLCWWCWWALKNVSRREEQREEEEEDEGVVRVVVDPVGGDRRLARPYRVHLVQQELSIKNIAWHRLLVALFFVPIC